MPFFSRRRGNSIFALAPELLQCSAILKTKHGHKILKLAVDTGANFTMVSTQAALAVGLNIAQSKEKEEVVTASGVIHAPVMEIPLFGALGVELHGFKVVCHDLPSQSRVDGILGLDFLSYFPPFHTFREEILKIAPQFWRS